MRCEMRARRCTKKLTRFDLVTVNVGWLFYGCEGFCKKMNSVPSARSSFTAGIKASHFANDVDWHNMNNLAERYTAAKYTS